MLKKGDLVRMPANCYLCSRPSDLHIVDRILLLKKPEIGIFIKYGSGNQALIFIRNNYWSADLSDIKLCRSKDAS